MINEKIEFAKLRLPSGYSSIVSQIKKNLENATDDTNFPKRVNDYNRAKDSIGYTNTLSLISDDRLSSEKFLIGQIVTLSQAQYFGNAAKDAPDQVKPMLYYYAQNSLFQFFVHSLFSFSSTGGGHGLVIDKYSFDDKSDLEIDEIKVDITNSGFFARLMDAYTLLQAETDFSPIVFDSKLQQFKKSDHAYSILNKPRLSLGELLLKREEMGLFSKGNNFDIFDFVILFIASSLARYRPYYWNEIVEGKKGTQMV
jgi:hypothetical protein